MPELTAAHVFWLLLCGAALGGVLASLLLGARGDRALHKGTYFKTDEFQFHSYRLMAPAVHYIDASQGNPDLVDEVALYFPGNSF